MVQTKKFEQTFVNQYMAYNLHDLDVRRQGRAEGAHNAKLEAARLMKANNLATADIVKYTGLTEKEVQEL